MNQFVVRLIKVDSYIIIFYYYLRGIFSSVYKLSIVPQCALPSHLDSS